MRKVLITAALLVLLAVPALAEVIAQPAAGRIFPDGVIDEADWLEAEWRLVPYTAVVNPAMSGLYSGNDEAAMLFALRYDSRFIYYAAKVVADHMPMFPLSAVELWLGDVQVIAAQNYMGEPFFQWSVQRTDGLQAFTPIRSRMAMVKTDDIDPQNQYGLSGVPGYIIELAVAVQELEALGVYVDMNQPMPFATGYYRKPDDPSLALRDGLIYFPQSYVAHDPETYAALHFGK